MFRAVEGAARAVAAVRPKRKGVVLPPITYSESGNQSDRQGSPVTLVVVHDTEGNYAGSISWLRNPGAQASAHLVLKEDGSEATQLVPWSRKAWHAVAFNRFSIGLEMAGIARLGFRDEELRRAARIVAFFLHKYGLPPRHVRPKSDGSIGKGFTLHQDLGVAGGGHHDPGFTSAKSRWFDALVAFEYQRGGFRQHWGVESLPV